MIKGPSLALLTVCFFKKKFESFLKNALSKDCLGEFFLSDNLFGGGKEQKFLSSGFFFFKDLIFSLEK